MSRSASSVLTSTSFLHHRSKNNEQNYHEDEQDQDHGSEEDEDDYYPLTLMRQNSKKKHKRQERMIQEQEQDESLPSSSTTSTTTTQRRSVHLVTSGANLLSGGLSDCQSPQDESCSGGIAAVSAMSRFYLSQYYNNYQDDDDQSNNNNDNNNDLLIIQQFDKSSPFVNMHPLQWVVNRLVIREIFKLSLFIEAPSILNQNKIDSGNVSQRDISGLQTSDMPLLLSNVAVPPTNSWYPFVKTVHFDDATGLATIVVLDSEDVPFAVSQIDSAKAAMNYIALVNQRNGCSMAVSGDDAPLDDGDADTVNVEPTDYQRYILNTPELQLFEQETITGMTNLNATATTPSDENDNSTQQSDGTTNSRCWIPVIIFSDIEESYWKFLQALTSHTHRPGFIMTLDSVYESFDTPQIYQDTGVWVSRCGMNSVRYCHHTIDVAVTTTTTVATTDGNNNNNTLTGPHSTTVARRAVIHNVTLIEDDIRNLNDTMKDELWETHIRQLAILASDARLNDPEIGDTGFIPVMREGSYRACKAGECAVGNLFTDALRWYSQSDIAFTSSGGYRGPGKPAGPTRFGDLYAALPFPNTMCTGTMTGISLFQLLNYTTSVSTFEGEDTDMGGRLLQVSGMRVTYNTQLPEPSRLVAVDIWDRESESYEPIDRLKLYTFATDSYICGAYDPYPDLTGGNFDLPGEIPGRIGDALHHTIVADYLSQLEQPYDTSIQGRLRNDTSAVEYLNLVETQESCEQRQVTSSLSTMIWNPETLSCIACPMYNNIVFSDEIFEFKASHDGEYEHDDITKQTGRVLLMNREPFPVNVRPSAIPRWVDMTSAIINNVEYWPPSSASTNSRKWLSIASGDSLIMTFQVRPDSVVGSTGSDRTALGSVAFSIQDGGLYPGCVGTTNPTFDVVIHVSPPDDFNHLGNFRYVGIAMTAVVFITAAVCFAWVYHRRFTRVVKVLQPMFLYTVCLGVCVAASSMIPLSFDDEIFSERGCGVACMSVPWLLSMGFTISFAALYAKLLRINKLFNHGNFRRIVVASKDVMVPFSVLFTLNFVLLLVWTLVDPLRWERVALQEGQDWNTVGRCAGGTVSTVIVSLIGIVNLGSLVLACYEAFKARNISDEFSESKYIGVAVYGWLQIILVAIPVLFLIDNDNNIAKYFLQVSLIFVLSMSMLLVISLPALMNTFKEIGKSLLRVRISGLQREPSDGVNAKFRESLGAGSAHRDGTNILRSTQTGGVIISAFSADPIREEVYEEEDQNTYDKSGKDTHGISIDGSCCSDEEAMIASTIKQ